MRVTKTIREFIEKEVSNRLDAQVCGRERRGQFPDQGGAGSVGSGYGRRTDSL